MKEAREDDAAVSCLSPKTKSRLGLAHRPRSWRFVNHIPTPRASFSSFRNVNPAISPPAESSS